MVSEIIDMEYIIVDNEHDALILENVLIKQLKPKYNILLRDDKTYPYIFVNMGDDFPRFEITRKLIDQKYIRYFGPFTSNGQYILKALYNTFPLIQTKSCLRGKKACLFHQIKKCLAPCEGKVSKEDYRLIVKEAIAFLSDEKIMKKSLVSKMETYAENLQFEEALELKKSLQALGKSTLSTPIDLVNKENIDIFAIAIEDNRCAIVKSFMRLGKLTSSVRHIYKHQFDIDRDEIYQRVIIDFYTKACIIKPDQILIADDITHTDNLNAFIAEQLQKKIPLHYPQKGNKAKLIKLTRANAEQFLAQHQEKQHNDKPLLELKARLDLEQIPFRIEAFDNSHLSLQAKVGAMVVYEEGIFIKSDYKQYHLQALDEYAQMRELLTRRLKASVRKSSA